MDQPNRSSQSSRQQAIITVKSRPATKGQRNRQPKNARDATAQPDTSLQAHHPQPDRSFGYQQNSRQTSFGNDHQPNAHQQRTASWSQVAQNPAPQSFGQITSSQDSSRPQCSSLGNAHRLVHRPKRYGQSLNPKTHINGRNQQKLLQNKTAHENPHLTPLQLILSYTQEWNPDIYRNQQPFAKLPGDLVLCIMDHLPDPVDKMSLALTTKIIWELSQKVLKLEKFALQQILPIRLSEQRGLAKPWPYFRSHRWKLIERLEDNRWKACSGCLRLHPKTEFFDQELNVPAKERYCRAPGLIAMCPHIILTYKKCEALQIGLAQRVGGCKQSDKNAIFHKGLNHECHMTKGPFQLRIKTQPFITEKNQQLALRQEYIIHVNSKNWKEDLLSFGIRSLLPNLCPHRSLATHCLDMLDERSTWNKDMISEDHVGDEGNVTCKFCGTYFSRWRHVYTNSDEFRVEFFVSKKIGDDLGLLDCKLGHGIGHELQWWMNKTQLANIVDVTESTHYGCKCDKKCHKLGYEPRSYASPRASLPDTPWKRDAPVWRI